MRSSSFHLEPDVVLMGFTATRDYCIQASVVIIETQMMIAIREAGAITGGIIEGGFEDSLNVVLPALWKRRRA
jgi:hypothetical protein